MELYHRASQVNQLDTFIYLRRLILYARLAFRDLAEEIGNRPLVPLFEFRRLGILGRHRLGVQYPFSHQRPNGRFEPFRRVDRECFHEFILSLKTGQFADNRQAQGLPRGEARRGGHTAQLAGVPGREAHAPRRLRPVKVHGESV